MSTGTKKEDLRRIKTVRALNGAMFTLLEKRNFGKITVMDICREALISRAAFYAHFADKYDLLRDWLGNLLPESTEEYDAYDLIERKINRFVDDNKNVIRNIINGADGETMDILFDFMSSTLNSYGEQTDADKNNPHHVVLSVFYSGGMVYYLLWQAQNKFPPDVAAMNPHLFEIISKFCEWKSEQ